MLWVEWLGTIFVYMKHVFFLVFATVLLTSQCSAQNVPDTLTYYLERLADKSSFPGFAVSLVDSSGIRYAHAFGSADQLLAVEYTTETIQPVGGISNTFVGLALMKAVELGLLELDTKVNAIIPFNVINPNAKGEHITLRHLATHTSGILDGPDIFDFAYSQGTKTRSTLNKFLRSYLTPKGRYFHKKNFGKDKPGARYEYSKMGVTLAAYVVEVAAKMPFEDFVQQHIFDPLNMKSTGWFYDAVDPAQHAVLYADWRAPLASYTASVYPSVGLRTSITDLSIYLQEIIRGAQGREGLVSKMSYEEMLEPMFDISNMPKNMDRSEPNEGVFWVHRHNGLVGHTGSDPGITSLMLFDPTNGTGKILMANLEIEEDKVADQMVDIWRTLQAFEERIFSNEVGN